MKLIIPDNNDPQLISLIKELMPINKNNNIGRIYGKPTSSKYFGTGRSNTLFDDITRKDFEKRVQSFSNIGIEYEYAMNGILPKARIIENREYVIDELSWLESTKVHSLIVCNYELAFLAQKYAPRLKLVISTFAGIDNVEKMKQWCSLKNIETIVIDRSIYRSLSDLNKITTYAKKKKIATCVIANLGCMTNCIRTEEHAIIKDFASDKHNFLHYAPCTFYCLKYLIQNPIELAKLPIIRPNDLHRLENVGIDYVKLVDRTQPTSWIEKVIYHYLVGEYTGNILDLTCNFSREGVVEMTNEEVENINMKKIISDSKEVIKYRKILPELLKLSIANDHDFLECNKSCEICNSKCPYLSFVNFDSERRQIVLKQLTYLENEYLFK